MNFVYEPEVLELMEKSGKRTIVVELVMIENSDIEIADFHVQLANERIRNNFIKKKYRIKETEHGEVLLPRFPLEYSDTVTFKVKKFLWFKSLTVEGIKI